jgi:hypothetical protein
MLVETLYQTYSLSLYIYTYIRITLFNSLMTILLT